MKFINNFIPNSVCKFLLLSGVPGLLLFSGTLYALSMVLPGFSGGHHTVNIKSYKERKFNTVYKQQFDYSCGSSALASLLTYHYDFPVTEQLVFNAMYQQGDQKKIQRQGFSLLDMKRYIEKKGLRAEGYRISLDRLAKVAVPAITLVNNAGYKHFVIVKGVTDKEVLIGDPSVGTKTIPRKEFEAIWNSGIVFIINSRISIARSHFNEEWKLNAKAPGSIALTMNPVADFNLMLPPPSDF